MDHTDQPGPQPKKKFKINKKFLLPAIAIVVIAAGAGGYLLTKKDKPDNSGNAKADPCVFFSLADAKALLGDKTKKGGLAPIAQASSKDIAVNTCSYYQELQTTQPSAKQVLKSASVMVRTPKGDVGKRINEYQFGDGKQAGMEDVSSYGQKSFWDPQLKVLNVLKSDKWVTLSYGSTNSSSTRTLNDTKKLADIVVPKL
jgi:hypothetical protein